MLGEALAMATDPGESELVQADLSRLRLQDMTPAQRAELLRRYTAFVKHFGVMPEESEKKPSVRKWIPGERR